MGLPRCELTVVALAALGLGAGCGQDEPPPDYGCEVGGALEVEPFEGEPTVTSLACVGAPPPARAEFMCSPDPVSPFRDERCTAEAGGTMLRFVKPAERRFEVDIQLDLASDGAVTTASGRFWSGDSWLPFEGGAISVVGDRIEPDPETPGAACLAGRLRLDYPGGRIEGDFATGRGCDETAP
jgi:hypothetical protein